MCVPGEISRRWGPDIGTCSNEVPFKCSAGGNNEREETNMNLHFVALNWRSLLFMKVETAFCSCIWFIIRIDDSLQGHVIGKHVEATIPWDNFYYMVNIGDKE